MGTGSKYCSFNKRLSCRKFRAQFRNENNISDILHDINDQRWHNVEQECIDDESRDLNERIIQFNNGEIEKVEYS